MRLSRGKGEMLRPIFVLVMRDVAFSTMSIAQVVELVRHLFTGESVPLDLMVDVEDSTERVEEADWLVAKVTLQWQQVDRAPLVFGLVWSAPEQAKSKVERSPKSVPLFERFKLQQSTREMALTPGA